MDALEEINAQLITFIYALMSRKSEECYRRLFQDLTDFGDNMTFISSHSLFLTNFEQAAINAAHANFCHFHLAQSIYRKVQALVEYPIWHTDKNLVY